MEKTCEQKVREYFDRRLREFERCLTKETPVEELYKFAGEVNLRIQQCRALFNDAFWVLTLWDYSDKAYKKYVEAVR